MRKLRRHQDVLPKKYYSSDLLDSTHNVSNEMTDGVLAMLRMRRSLLLIWGLALCLFSLFYISLPPTNSTTQCDCRDTVSKVADVTSVNPKIHPIIPVNTSQSSNIENKNIYKKHKLAILVPFRDRFEELLEFAPHIHKFLEGQQTAHHIYILNQVDNLRFNRASLLNVGFLESSVDCDYISLHDVDLLPIPSDLRYDYPRNGPYHVAAPHLHPRYHYPTFIGGILLLSREHFRAVNGLSNKYWGWGLEDDELYARFKEAKLRIQRPGNLTTGTKDTFRHIHDRKVRKRDMIKCYNQQDITRRRDRQTGLSTVRYHIHSQREMNIEGALITIINIMLECDYTATPWCNCTETIGNTNRSKRRRTEDVIVPRLDRRKHLTPDG